MIGRRCRTANTAGPVSYIRDDVRREGRISVLSRGRGMKRCLAEGIERFELWVAAAVLANNLMIIATLLTKRLSRRRRANK